MSNVAPAPAVTTHDIGTIPVQRTVPEPLAPAPAPKRRGPWTNVVSLVLATLLLGASVAAGFWLVDSAPATPGTPTANKLTAVSSYEAYGGDAYTGIQNTQADTESSVIAGANNMTRHASELQANQLEADAAWWGHLWKGLAALIVAIGAANFLTTLQRFGAVRRQLA